MSDSDAGKILVCLLAEAEWAAAGATYDRFCSQCGARLMIAPSSKALLKREPNIPLVCIGCWAATADPEVPITWAASPAELMQELRTAQANVWRKRN